MAKTTVEIGDELLARAKAHAVRERTTLRELVETGLRAALRGTPSGSRFRLRDASVGGNGLQPEFRTGGWDRLRDAIYDDRR